MVTLSVSAVGGYGYLDKQNKLEAENEQLREQLRAERLDHDLNVSVIERDTDVEISEAKASQRLAVERAAELTFENRTLVRRTARAEGQRAVATARAELAEHQAQRATARAEAADRLAHAAESYAFELDLRLTRSIRAQHHLRNESAELRALASRHLPEIAPDRARTDLDLLRGDLDRAKRTTSQDRAYLVGLACSGLRTFEASAAGYSDGLGQRLMSEARQLRADPACVAFDGDGEGGAHAVMLP